MKKAILISAILVMGIALLACSKEKEFYFEYQSWVNPNSKNIFSTKDAYIQKDLIESGVKKEEWKISAEDEAAIKKLIEKYNLKDVSKRADINSYSGNDEIIISSNEQQFYIEFSIEGKVYKLEGDESVFKAADLDGEAKNVCDFLNEVREILQNQEVYKNMPEAEGAYQ